MHVIVVTSKN